MDDAVAIWHMNDLSDASSRNSVLTIDGDVELGVPLEGEDRAASLARGGDGKAALFRGGWLNAGQGADGELRLSGKTMTLLLRYRDPTGENDTPLFSKHGGHSRLSYNLFVTDLGAGPAMGFELGTTWNDRPLQLSAPLSRIGATAWHDVIARFDDARLDLSIDGVLVDEEWPIGSLRTENPEPCLIGAESINGQVKCRFRGMVDHAALWNRALGDAEVVALSGGNEAVAARQTAIIGRPSISPAYQRPPGLNVHAGDCMPFFHEGTFHLFYLYDRRHHHSKWGLGAHQWAHLSTRDLVRWQQQPMALPITRQEEGSICTGSVLFHDGTYHAFYAVRALDDRQSIYHAISTDAVRFDKGDAKAILLPQPGYDPMHYRDPEVFHDPGTHRFHMLVTARFVDGRDGCIAHLESTDLKEWALKDPLLVPGRVTDCPNYFAWNNRHYLLAEHVYWMSRSPFGPWTEPKPNRLDVLYVPKTAQFTGGRRIYVSWLSDVGWGGDFIFRELFQNSDGTLGTRFVPELTPASGKLLRNVWEVESGEVAAGRDSVSLGPSGRPTATLLALPANAHVRFRVSAGGRPGQTGGFGVRPSAGGKPACALRIEPQERKVSLGKEAIALQSLEDLDRPIAVDLILKNDIVDACLDNRNTLVGRSVSGARDCLVFFTEGIHVTFSQIEIRPLAK